MISNWQFIEETLLLSYFLTCNQENLFLIWFLFCYSNLLLIYKLLVQKHYELVYSCIRKYLKLHTTTKRNIVDEQEGIYIIMEICHSLS